MIKKFLDLGYQPLANSYRLNEKSLSKVKNDLYKLEVSFDNNSKLVSISKKVSKKKCLMTSIHINLQCLKRC